MPHNLPDPDRESGPARFSSSQPLVFLPGWGFDGSIIELAQPAPNWLHLAGPLSPLTLEAELLALLATAKIDQVDLIGWSMGAHLALDFAKAWPDKVGALFLLSMRRQWPAPEISRIKTELKQQPESFLRSFYRQCFLGDRDNYQRFALQFQERYLATMPLEILNQGLDYLGRAEILPASKQIRLSISHGAHDRIAPLAERALLPGAEVRTLSRAGHLLFLDPGFSLGNDRNQKKIAIQQRFSRAALSYDRYAEIQQQSGNELLARLAPEPPVRHILEIGCGTGNYTSQLLQHFPAAEITALDFSPDMLKAAAAKLGKQPQITWHCQEAEQYLAECEDTFDLVTANATLQWFHDLKTAFARVKASLRSRGLFLCSLFGPRTLEELGQGLEQTMAPGFRLPAASFPDRQALAADLAACFGPVEIEEIILNRHYPLLRDLLQQIRKTGTGGWHDSRLTLSRGRLRKLEEWFLESHGAFQATYQIFIIKARNDQTNSGVD